MTALVSIMTESPGRTYGFRKLAYLRRRFEEGQSALRMREIVGGIVGLSVLASELPSIFEAKGGT